jgi:signal transduction protein with GAF and PtsI domain
MPSIPDSVQQALDGGSLEDALRATLSHFGCQAGTVHLLEDGLLKLRGSVGIPPQVTAIVQTVPIGKGIAGLAAERRAPVTICNLQTDDSGQARPGARATGMEGSLAVPMLDENGTLRGVLGVAKAEAYDWPEAETAGVLAIAAQFGRASA